MTVKGKGTKTGTVVEEGAVMANEGMDTAFKAGSDAASKVFAMSKDRMEAAVKGYDDITAFSKDNIEAMVAAGNLTAKAVETFNAELLAFGKSAIEDSIAAAQAVMGAKTLKEVVELQTEFAKNSFDTYMQQSTKLGEMGTKLAQEALQPLNARMQAAFEKFVKPVAA